MFYFQVIDAQDASWDEKLKTIPTCDFYHTRFFHLLDNAFASKLLVFKNETNLIVLPVVIRPIENTNYNDITSVYGYAGPLFQFENETAKAALLEFFKNQFFDFCKQENIVTVFSRLHPFIPQEEVLLGLGEVVLLNKTVAVSLHPHEVLEKKGYGASTRNQINKLRKQEVRPQWVTDDKSIAEFHGIYCETMQRLNAAPFYYFSFDYFKDFLNNAMFQARLMVVKVDDVVVAGAIFTQMNGIMQYHLSGLGEAYTKSNMMKLIIDEARHWGAAQKLKVLHLGGGLAGRDDDSLFLFKSSFSKEYHQFAIWKYVVNPYVYASLAKNKPKSSFFPLYRS